MSDIEKPDAVAEATMKEETEAYDPDAGLSGEEKLKIVRMMSPISVFVQITNFLNSLGTEALMEN
jgi:hypothetical protein